MHIEKFHASVHQYTDIDSLLNLSLIHLANSVVCGFLIRLNILIRILVQVVQQQISH